MLWPRALTDRELVTALLDGSASFEQLLRDEPGRARRLLDSALDSDNGYARGYEDGWEDGRAGVGAKPTKYHPEAGI